MCCDRFVKSYMYGTNQTTFGKTFLLKTGYAKTFKNNN